MQWCARIGTLVVLLTGAGVLCSAAAAVAAPFVPTNDGEILERLPVSPLDAGARRLHTLRRQLADRPDNLALATRLAWMYIEQGRRLSDPRYFGYAQGALAPWWREPQPPVAVLVLRATIRQHDHDFDGALDDLSRAVRVDPQNAQAWLTRATVLQVRGAYEEARRNCLEVLQLATPLVAVTCVSAVDSLNGAAQKSHDMLQRAFTQAHEADDGARVWALTVLAETAARLGQSPAAEEHFGQALSFGHADDYLLGAYADFLLDQGRADVVRVLLKDATRSDALLLRLTLAEQALSAPDLDDHVQALRDRFAAARLRGDSVHRREESRFALRLLKQPGAALQLARENWNVQREPWDARVLLEAAVAVGDREGAQPGLTFLAATHLEDVFLARLAAQLSEPHA